MSWKWRLPLEPAGDDEAEVKALYEAEMVARDPPLPWVSWEDLDEWVRESWRREYRDK